VQTFAKRAGDLWVHDPRFNLRPFIVVTCGLPTVSHSPHSQFSYCADEGPNADGQPFAKCGIGREVTNREEFVIRTGLFVRLEAKPGKGDEVETFLRGARDMVEQEPATIAWFALRMGPSTFAIFDVFPDDAGRQAHLSGKVALALMEKSSDLLIAKPTIERLDVLASKLPDEKASKAA
jgi:quinol monooxygenase YgiN